MNSFKNRLKQIMSERNISQSELSRRTGIGRNSISDYLKGKYEAKQDKVFELAKVLNVNEAWLMGFDISKDRIINDNDITTVYNQLTPPRQQNVLDFANHQLELQNSTDDNVIDLDTYKNENTTLTDVNGYVSAGTGEQIFDEPKFKVSVKGYVPPHDLALQVNGNSMEPMFSDKEIIFVEKSNNIKNGQIGVFIINGEAYVKKVHVGEDRLTLVSLNKDYRDLHFYENEGVRLIGKVIL
ncbi:LexA family transcriptional regulator [Staphylococcus hominis]|uniref:LexA family transcriptional regulator n=1 Tax=Staphylococcus hominis TaxID=1290 RepID=UPI00287AC31C|nr:LexA family transcriptional regulator [Staphylococcus hominis]MDS3866898.1 LexA family transcriptional regulator [Staphylococcus hominis]